MKKRHWQRGLVALSLIGTMGTALAVTHGVHDTHKSVYQKYLDSRPFHYQTDDFAIDLNHDGKLDLLRYVKADKKIYGYMNHNGRFLQTFKLDDKQENGRFRLMAVSADKNKHVAFSVTIESTEPGAENVKYFYGLKNNQPVRLDEVDFNWVHHKHKRRYLKVDTSKATFYFTPAQVGPQLYQFVEKFGYIE